MASENQDRKQIALKMLLAGHATPAEVARIAGVSRQLVYAWALGMDWRSSRNAFIQKLWKHWAEPSHESDSHTASPPPSGQSAPDRPL